MGALWMLKDAFLGTWLGEMVGEKLLRNSIIHDLFDTLKPQQQHTTKVLNCLHNSQTNCAQF